MKIRLHKDVPGAGRAGDIIPVSDAYARNFLLPRRIGTVASAKDIADYVATQAAQATSEENRKKSWAAARQRLQGVTIRLKRRQSENGTLFAAVHESEICQSLTEQYGLSFSGTHVSPSTIKTSGQHTVKISWPDRGQVDIIVEVTPE